MALHITKPLGPASDPLNPPEKPLPMKVLALGLPRTGTYSMTLALRELGYENVYHILDWTFARKDDWRCFSEAADALFPSLPTFNGKGMTRKDWDLLFGCCEVITDISGVFPESLLEAYPEAKVIYVERPEETWIPSIMSLLTNMFGAEAEFGATVTEPLAGVYLTRYVQKTMQGWLGLSSNKPTMEEREIKARELYKWHVSTIPELVPEDRLLRYRMGQGWEPICEFLGKEVPDMPFPHANDAAALKKAMKKSKTILRVLALIRVAKFTAVVGAAVGVSWLLRGRVL